MNTNTVITAESALKVDRPGVMIRRLVNTIRWHEGSIQHNRDAIRKLREEKLLPDYELGRQIRRSIQTIEDLSGTIFDIKRATGRVPNANVQA